MLTPGRRRRSERGQALLLALGLIALTAFVAVAVARYGDVTFLQRRHTENTAANDGLVEGGAAYAAADAKAGGWTCAAGTGGLITFQSGEQLGYTVNSCNPRGAGGPPGVSCAICVLKTPGAALTVGKNGVTVNGPVTVNGDLTLGNGTLTATAVGVGGSFPASGVTPPAVHITPIADPLASLPAPQVSGPSKTYSGGAQINPGLYGSVAISGTVTFNPGVYVFTGGLSLSGQAAVTGSGVLLYFACSTYPTPCASGAGGAGLSVGGSWKGTMALTAPGSGPYQGDLVFYDRNDATPLTIAGNGSPSFGGTVYAASSDAGMNGNGSWQQPQGSIVVHSLSLSGNGGMGVTSGGSPNPCSVYDDEVTVGGANRGHALVQAGCTGGTGIVDLNYQP